MAKRVCIDAGHYGKYNVCPNNTKYFESDMVWKLHLLQKKYLEKLGIEVVTTRPEQGKDLALFERGSKSRGCDLFISNHSNAVGSVMNETVDYVAVYHLTNDVTTMCDDVSKAIAQKLAPVITSIMGVKQGYKVLDRKASDDRNGDGVLNDNYYGVLNGARQVNVPGLILEHSFHTNSKVVNWLLNDSNLDRLAKAEAECIASYLLGKTVTVESVSKPVVNNTASGVTYRVQVGAYKDISNAKAQLNKIKSKGFNAILIKRDNLYKVQVGAYNVKANADNMLSKLKSEGFDGFISTQGGDVVSDNTPPKKSVEEIAREVIAGKWGNGNTRKQRLTQAGYNYNEVQAKVNQLL